MGSINDGFDREFLLDVSGGDEEFIVEITNLYLETAPVILANLETALREGDLSAAIHSAHTLKGSSRSVGANVVADISANMERALKGQDTAEAVAALPSVRNALMQLLEPPAQAA